MPSPSGVPSTYVDGIPVGRSFFGSVTIVSGATSTYSAVNKDVVTIKKGHVISPHTSGSGVRLASGATNTKHAVGLMLEETIVGAAGKFQTEGIVSLSDWTDATGSVLLKPNAIYYVDIVVSGKMSFTAPASTSAGKIVQVVGRSVSPTEFEIRISDPILL